MYSMLGLQCKHSDEHAITYHFNNDLLTDGLLLEEATFVYEGDNEDLIADQVIVVRYLSSKNSHIFTLYWDEPLESIRSYRIIKDILELYKHNSVDTFIDIISSFSVAYISSDMQEDISRRKQMYKETKEVFEFVKQ